MSVSAKVPCRHIGCRLLLDTPGYCKAHTKPKWQKKSGGRKRMSGRPWRRLREIVIKRDHGLCQPCQIKGKMTEFKEIDHIIPVTQGGSDSISNLQCICISCHNKKTATENR